MSLRIIDKKRIDLTDDEYDMYKSIVQAYTKPPYQKGEDFFIDLFETDENGIILFLKPPSNRHISFEIFLFMMSVFQAQHLRIMHQKVNEFIGDAKQKLNLD
jgi:hypothetical protein